MIGAVLNPPFSPFEDTIQLPSGLQLNLRKKVVEAAVEYGVEISFSTFHSLILLAKKHLPNRYDFTSLVV
jgi:hypothetical protein